MKRRTVVDIAIVVVVSCLLVAPLVWPTKGMPSIRNLVFDMAMAFAAVGLLVALCALHWRKPWLFSSFKKCAYWILGLSLWSWLVFGGGMFIAIEFLYIWPDNGFAAVCAYALGWLYIWPSALAVGVLYLVLRMLAKAVSRAMRSMTARDPNDAVTSCQRPAGNGRI